MTSIDEPEGRPYRGVPLAERRKERRQRLMAAGRQVFGENGFRGTTVKMVCREAGLTERYFYESFDSREALFKAVVEAGAAELRQRILDTVAGLGSGADARAVARAALRSYFGLMRDEPGLARLLLFEVLGVSEEIDRAYYAALDEFSRMLLALAEPMAARGELRLAHAPELIAAGLIGAAQQIASRWVLHGYQRPLDEVVDSAFAIYAAVVRELEA